MMIEIVPSNAWVWSNIASSKMTVEISKVREPEIHLEMVTFSIAMCVDQSVYLYGIVYTYYK